MAEDVNRSSAPKLTIAFCSFAVGVVTTLVGAGYHYGELSSDLKTANQRIVDYQDALKTNKANVEQWRSAYEQQAQQLTNATARVNQLQNDRCTSLKMDIDSLRSNLEVSQSWGNQGRKEMLEKQLSQYQDTLRACYSGSR